MYKTPSCDKNYKRTKNDQNNLKSILWSSELATSELQKNFHKFSSNKTWVGSAQFFHEILIRIYLIALGNDVFQNYLLLCFFKVGFIVRLKKLISIFSVVKYHENFTSISSCKYWITSHLFSLHTVLWIIFSPYIISQVFTNCIPTKV